MSGTYTRLLAAGLGAALFAAGIGVAITTPSQAATAISIFGSAVPMQLSDPDAVKVELGVQFKSDVPGRVTGIRFYKGSGNTGVHTAALWSGSTKIAAGAFTNETAQGWQTTLFPMAVAVAAGKTYTASYFAPVGHYSVNNPFGFPKSAGVLTAIRGVYRYGGGYPASVYQSSNYWIDVIFVPADQTPVTTATLTSSSTLTSQSSTRSSTTSSSASTTTNSSVGSTSTATSATSTQSGSGRNCAPKPSSCGYPDSTTTGAKGALRRVPLDVSSGPGWQFDSRGWVSVFGNGALLENLDIPYNLDINGASDVVIRNVRVTVSGESFGISLRHARNALLQDVTITSPVALERLMVAIKDIYGDSSGTIIRRADVSGTSTGIQMDQGIVEDSYIHDLRLKSGDHINGTTSNGGSTLLVIRHNTVFNSYAQTDAVSLFQDFGAQQNRIIDNNLLAGGGYTIYGGANPGKEVTATYIRLTNNRISRIYFPNGGAFGWLAAWNQSGAGNVLSGNFWDDTGELIR